MRNKFFWGILLTLSLVVCGELAYGKLLSRTGLEQPRASSYVCPLTGEVLPCPNCCPLSAKP